MEKACQFAHSSTILCRSCSFSTNRVEATATIVVVKRTPLLPHPFLKLCLGFSRIAPLPWQLWYRVVVVCGAGGGCREPVGKIPFHLMGLVARREKELQNRCFLGVRCPSNWRTADGCRHCTPLPQSQPRKELQAEEPTWMTGVVQPRGHSADPDSPNPPNVSANQKAMLLWATA